MQCVRYMSVYVYFIILDCFNWTKDKPEISNKTYHFYQIFNETMQCIEENINPKENSTKVCENCMQSYIQLNNYYESLSFDRIGLDIICMDVIDSVSTLIVTMK